MLYIHDLPVCSVWRDKSSDGLLYTSVFFCCTIVQLLLYCRFYYYFLIYNLNTYESFNKIESAKFRLPGNNAKVSSTKNIYILASTPVVDSRLWFIVVSSGIWLTKLWVMVFILLLLFFLVCTVVDKCMINLYNITV